MNGGFLPMHYKVPVSGQFMKLVDGDNKFRILASAVVGWVGWKNGKPFRRPGIKQNINPTEVELSKYGKPRIDHFWAFPVWNYKDNKIQILEVTQKGIMKDIENYYMIEDWGDPVNRYDLVIKKFKEGDMTKYSVTPLPHKETSPEIKREFAESKIDLNKLFDGEYPMPAEDDFAIVPDEPQF